MTTTYDIERDGEVIATGLTDTGFLDESLAFETGYTYRVRGRNEFGVGPWSEPVFLTTEEDPDPPPELDLILEEEFAYSDFTELESANGNLWRKYDTANNEDLTVLAGGVGHSASEDEDLESLYLLRAGVLDRSQPYRIEIDVQTLDVEVTTADPEAVHFNEASAQVQALSDGLSTPRGPVLTSIVQELDFADNEDKTTLGGGGDLSTELVEPHLGTTGTLVFEEDSESATASYPNISDATGSGSGEHNDNDIFIGLGAAVGVNPDTDTGSAEVRITAIRLYGTRRQVEFEEPFAYSDGQVDTATGGVWTGGPEMFIDSQRVVADFDLGDFHNQIALVDEAELTDTDLLDVSKDHEVHAVMRTNAGAASGERWQSTFGLSYTNDSQELRVSVRLNRDTNDDLRLELNQARMDTFATDLTSEIIADPGEAEVRLEYDSTNNLFRVYLNDVEQFSRTPFLALSGREAQRPAVGILISLNEPIQDVSVDLTQAYIRSYGFTGEYIEQIEE